MKTAVVSGSLAFLFLLPAVLMGALFGVFVHGCWLIDLFSIESKGLLVATLIAVFLGTAGYFLAFRWLPKRWMNFGDLHQALLAGGSILAGMAFLLAAWNGSQRPNRYIGFFLPAHEFRASIFPAQTETQVSLFQFKTGVGIIPFEELEYKGWEVRGERLWLVDPADNEIRWTGKTGEQVEITIESIRPGVEVIVGWDGQENRLPLLVKKYIYLRSFEIPFFASRAWILLAGFINGLALSLPFFLVTWKRRMDLKTFFFPLLCGAAGRVERWEWIVMVSGVTLALALRLPNLEMWSLVGVDEYSHLIAAKRIAEYGSLQVEYTRSLWTVTLPIALAFKALGYHVWAARLTGVLFNALAIVPLYFVARKINRPVAALSVLLFAASPWMIVFSRIIREYAYYPFYYFVVVYLMILFLEKFPASFRAGRDWKSVLQPSLLLPALALAISPVYAAWFDPESTFRLILLAYGVFGLFLFLRLDFKDKTNLILAAGTMAALLGTGWALSSRLSLDILSPSFNPAPLGFFLPNPPQQWYFERLPLLPMFGLLAAVIASLLARQKNFIPLFILGVWIVSLGFFVFSGNTYYAPRHLSVTQIWYIVLMALGLYLAWMLLGALPILKNALPKLAALLALGLLTFNASHSLLAAASSRALDAVSGDYFYDFRLLQNRLDSAAREDDVLLAATPYLRHALWTGAPVYSAMRLLSVTVSESELLSILDEYPSGWIVVDETRIPSFSFSLFDSLAKDDRVEYVGLFGDEHLWHWDESSP